MGTCKWCEQPITPFYPAAPRIYCSTRCKQTHDKARRAFWKAFEARPVPTLREWYLAHVGAVHGDMEGI